MHSFLLPLPGGTAAGTPRSGQTAIPAVDANTAELLADGAEPGFAEVFATGDVPVADTLVTDAEPDTPDLSLLQEGEQAESDEPSCIG